MANVNSFASVAAAVSAGYSSTAEDRGATLHPRYRRYLEKLLAGASGDGDGMKIRAIGEDDTSQANADTNALASLNSQRYHYYAGAPGRGSGTAQSATARGGAHTIDTT